MRFQNVYKFRAAFQCGGIFFIREKLDAFLFKERRLWWETSGRFVLARQLFGFDLAGFDVRLVEGVDADDGACDGGGDFPAKKFLAEIIGVRQSDAHDGMPSFFERSDRGILGLVRLRCQTHISENAIVAIGSRLGEAFAINRNNALADFSGGFGKQLFQPSAKIEDSRRSDDREFVSAVIRGDAKDGSQDDAWIRIGGSRSTTR